METRNRILFFLPSLKGGGAQNVAFKIANYFLDRYMVKVDFLVLNMNKRKEFTGAERFNIYSINIGNTRNSWFKIHRFLKMNHYDIVLSFNRQLSVLLVLLRLLNARKFPVIISRNITMLSKARQIEDSFWHKYIVFFFVKVLYRNCDFFISQSHAMTRDLVNNFSIPKNKIFTINNPVEISKKTDHYKKQSNISRLLYIGRLEKVKNIEFLLQSIFFLKKINSKFILNIVGEGALESDLKKFVSIYQLDDVVYFRGYSQNVDAFYADSDLFIMTSIYEGFPNVLVEANAYGVPVLVKNSDTGANDIVVDGINGFLYTTDSPIYFAKKIQDCMNYDWQKSKIMASTNKFNIENIGNQYFHLLK